MSVFLSEVWNALQNYTMGEQQRVIIEQVEPTSQVNPSLSYFVGKSKQTKSNDLIENPIPNVLPAKSLQIPHGRHWNEKDHPGSSCRPDSCIRLCKSQFLHVPGDEGNLHDYWHFYSLLYGRGEIRVPARARYPGIELNANQFFRLFTNIL